MQMRAVAVQAIVDEQLGAVLQRREIVCVRSGARVEREPPSLRRRSAGSEAAPQISECENNFFIRVGSGSRQCGWNVRARAPA